MSDEICEQGCSSKSNKLKDLQKSSINILNNKNSIKINEKFVPKLTKGSKNVNKDVKDSCKVLHFSSDWIFDDILAVINGLEPKGYPQLFIFIIEATNLGLSADNHEQSSSKIQEHLLKIGNIRPMILQLTSEDENVTQIYYKDETLSQFNVIDQQRNNFEEIENFPSFLCLFLNNKISSFEDKMTQFVNESSNLLLVLRFLRTLNLSDMFLKRMILEVTKKGSKAEFLAILDAPFDDCSNWLNSHVQKYLADTICINHSEPRLENSEEPDNPAPDTSVLLTAIINSNKEVINCLISYWTHLIQQLPFDHQVRISKNAFETNQPDVLCDLLDFADYPFSEDFQSVSVDHERLEAIIKEREELKAAIESENFDDIAKYIDINSSLKIVYNINNDSALKIAAESRKFNVFNYLKLRGFNTSNPNENFKEFDKEVSKYVAQQRKQNICKGLLDDQCSINSLCNRSLIHNKKISKEQEREYRKKIRKWYEDINSIKNGTMFLNVVASCQRLKIIFDFENDTVENASLAGPTAAGSMYPTSKWIFIGAKFSDENGKETKQREQQIKGVLAHELCHYVMRLVYENQEKPYYKNRKDKRKMFAKIVKIINKWSSEDSENPDDECNGIISSVFRLYDPKDFHPELIVRVVQILSEFDDSEDKSKLLEEKYKAFFDFWHIHVVPELEKYLQRNIEIIKLNGTFELLSSILKLKYELRNENKVEKIADSKLIVLQTNVPKLLFLNILQYLQKKVGNLIDSQNIFVDPEKLKNQQHLDDFNRICSDNQELRIFVDCTCQIPDCLGNIIVNKELNFTIIVSNEVQCVTINGILKEQNGENAQKLDINYNWSDLTKESQLLLLESKINFQNNSQLAIKDLIQIDTKACEATTSKDTKDDQEDINDPFDAQLLNLILENQQVLINTIEKDEISEQYFQLLFKPRDLVKMSVIPEDEWEIKKENLNSEEQNSSGFFGNIFRVFGKSKLETSEIVERIIKEQKLLQVQLLTEFKNKQYVLISDQAGNGKSWVMKNFTKILRDKNPTRWVTYVDLKQFIDEFKREEEIMKQNMELQDPKSQTAQKDQSEFSAFMVENILKLQHHFEVKIFQKLYKSGKVCILFDGFDEIAPNCAEFVSNIAQNFKSNGGNQLWIATRDFFEIDLQQMLKLDVAFRLADMTEKEGVDLIARSWVLMDLQKDKNEPKSKEDFDKGIKMSQEYESYRQKARKIIKRALISRNNSIGLPQLFTMIADGFKNEKNIDDLQGSKIYVKLIKILYKRWSEEKGQIRNEASIDSQDFEMNFYKFHQYHAILSLFPELVKILFPGYNGSEWPDEEVIACGILTKRNGKYYFIHETFREYFVADAIGKTLQNLKIEKKVIKIVDEILTVDKFKIIRTFLFPTLNKNSLLEKFKPKLQKLILREDKLFSDIFVENLVNLVDFAIKILKNEKYEKVKAMLDTNAISIVSNAQSSKMFLKFQEVLFDFLKIGDLKNLIVKQEVFHEIIGSSLKIEIFEDLAIKTGEKTDREFVRQVLMLVSRHKDEQNIFFFLSKSSNLNVQKVNKFLEIIEKFLTATEIFELMSKCNKDGQNILQACDEWENKENFIILWTEIEKYFAVRNFPQNFNEFVNMDGKNILDSAVTCDNIEVHVILWESLLTIFEDREKLKDFILQNYKKGNNFVYKLMEQNKKPEIVKFTFKILNENFNQGQFQEISTSKGEFEMNLIPIDFYRFKFVKIHQFLLKLYRDFCEADEKFRKMVKEVDEFRQNFLDIAACRNEIIIHETLWKLLLITFKDREELKDLVLQKNCWKKNFVDKLVIQNKNPAVIELTFKVLKENFSKAQFKEILHSKGYKEMNLLQTAAYWSKVVEVHQFLWKFYRNFCGSDKEFLEMVKEVDKSEQNILHIAAWRSSSGVFEFLIQELEKIVSRDEFREILKLLDWCDQNLLQTAAESNKSSELHKTLWKTLRKYFENSEILQFIKHVDEFGNNLLFIAVRHNTKEIVELTWNEIQSFMTHDEQVKYLKREGQDLIKKSLTNPFSNRVEVMKYIENLIKTYEI